MVDKVHNGGSQKATTVVSFSALKPQLFVEASKATNVVQFYKAAFGAEEPGHSQHPKRKADQELLFILSAQLKRANSTILVFDLIDDSAAPVKADGVESVICLETEDVEAAIAKVVAAGAVKVGETTEGEEGTCCGGHVGKPKDSYDYV